MADQFDDHNGDNHQEGWQDTQPPVDTFHDADMNAEGMATVSEEPGEHEDYEKTAGSETASVKKPSKLIPFAAGGGLLMVVLAVVFLHFGGGSSSPPPTVTAQMPPIKPPSTTPDIQAGGGLTVTDDGKLKALDQTAPLSDSSATNTATTNTAPGAAAIPSTADAPSAVLPNPVPAPIPAPVPPPAPVDTMAASQLPQQPQQPQPLMEQPQQQAQRAMLQPAVPAQVANESHNAELNSLSTRVEDLQKSLDQVTQQLTQVSSMVAAGQSNANSTPSPVVEERLNKIEQQLMQIQHAAPPSLSAPATANDVLGNPTIGMAKPDITTSDMPNKSSTHASASRHTHNTTHRVVRVASRKTSRHKSNRSAPSSDGYYVASTSTSGVLEAPHGAWVLRAATPNEAWVAKNETSSDLTHVRLGDELPGVGQVQSIRPVGDSWVIEGTEGVIH